MGKDSRLHNRFAYQGPFQLHWTDERGQAKFARAKCFDISEFGVRLECPEPIAVRTYAVLRADRIKFTGNASVRYCTRFAGKFIIGFEFSSSAKVITQDTIQTAELALK